MIISFLQILKKKTAEKLSEEENEFLGFAEDGAKRLKYQLDALLEYSRVSRHPLKKVLVKPAGLLENVRQDLKHLLEESGGEMHWKEMPEIAADPVLLERVFHNLIRNALIFTVAGKPEINISATPGKEGMVFKVSDNGIGIPEEFHDKVFEMFQRLHPPGRFPGSGIGLAVSRGIIERHKGKIWVNSAPGKGSTFHFLLPNRSLT
jgi:signal transduction histidine kinase